METKPEFVPPKRVELDVTDAIKALYGEKVVLVKDLQENQVICGQCNGLGLQKNDFRFGLRSDGDPIQHPMFPYHEQVFGPCAACFTGVQTLCKHCGKPYQRSMLQCTCEGCFQERAAKQREKELERQKHCKRIPYAEYKGEALYDDDADCYIYDGDSSDLDPSHTYFACKSTKQEVWVDKDDVLEHMRSRADEECEEGSEMLEVSKEGEEKLEQLLQKWFEEHVVLGKVFYPDRNTIVTVTPQDCGILWDEDGDEYEEGEEKQLFPCAEEGCTLLLHPSKVGEAPQRCKKHKVELCASSR